MTSGVAIYSAVCDPYARFGFREDRSDASSGQTPVQDTHCCGKISHKDWVSSKPSSRKTMTLAGEEFLRRFLQHVLPPGFVKVRHYGIFAHPVKAAAIQRVRESLRHNARAVAAAVAAILALLRDFAPPGPVRCPRCRSTRLTTTELLPGTPLEAWKPP